MRFEFDRPTEVSEVLLRLGSRRTTSYPLRLFADDKQVFEGIAGATVGYTRLSPRRRAAAPSASSSPARPAAAATRNRSK